MLATMPKHKGTDKLRALLRGKIARFEGEAQRKLATSKVGALYNISKEGAGQVVLLGLPNVGKSALVATLTSAFPKVADYPFTTKVPSPAMMKFENVQIQLVDMPPITDQDARPWLSHILRTADGLAIIVDLTGRATSEAISPTKQVELTFERLEELRIKPIRGEKKKSVAQRAFQKRAIILGNKNDLEGSKDGFEELISKYGKEFIVFAISAKKGINTEELRRKIFEMLDVIRVYTKAPGKDPDFDDPVTLKRESTVEDAARSVHKDFRNKLKYAQIWGSGKFKGQRVKRNHILKDGDIVELHT
jgi:hypothetical protein